MKMNSPFRLTRRHFLSASAVAGAAVAICARGASPVANAAPGAARARTLKLGVASISLRDLPVASVIGVLKQLEIGFVSIHGAHASFEKDSPEKCAATAKAFRDAGIAVATSSVVNMPNDEAAVRRAFDNARAAGLTLMTCKPTIEALPLVERFVKETGIRLAVHNHGPEDKVFPSPYDVLKAIAPFDARIGLCLDVGHAVRAGADPAKVIREASARLYDVHLKDTVAIAGATVDLPIEVGHGRIDIKAVVAALLDVNYTGVAAFEYERVGVNPIIGLSESIGYVRGIAAGLTT